MQHHYFVINICSFFNQQRGQTAHSALIFSFLFSSAVGYPAAAKKLNFLKSIGQDYFLPILLVKKSAFVLCTESGFLFWRCARSPSSMDRIAEIK
jgi:hypothetical protein